LDKNPAKSNEFKQACVALATNACFDAGARISARQALAEAEAYAGFQLFAARSRGLADDEDAA
jgi:hypothetical protein